MTEKNHAILFVDDEINILNSLKRLLRKEGYSLFTTTNAKEAFQILSENDIHMVISDQRMPDISGTELLAKVKNEYPDILRVILTGYTDVDSITDSINTGHIYKFFLKPWNDQNLKIEIRKALEQYELVKANQALGENLSHVLKDIEKENEKENYAIRLALAALNVVPTPLFVIDADFMINIINEAMKERFQKNIEEKEKIPVSVFFSKEVIDKMREGLQGTDSFVIEDVIIFETCATIRVMPFTGAFENKGAVITFEG